MRTSTLEVQIADDGSLDTLLHCKCRICRRTWTERIMDTADYRDYDTGEIDLLAIVEDFNIDCEMGECSGCTEITE